MSKIDNIVQHFCVKLYNKSYEDIKIFIVDLSEVSLNNNKVELAY